MTTIRPIFRPGRLRMSRIAYHCDLTDSRELVIPLGVIADIQVGDLYGLGLIARPKLTDSELANVGRLIRAKLHAPFDMLRADYDRVWDSAAPAAEFGNLAKVHQTALHFALASERSVKIPPVLHSLPERDLKNWVEDQLVAARNADFWALMVEHFPNSGTRKTEQGVRHAA